MRNAEHRGALAAFVMVFAVACLIVGNGLRTHVVDVLIGSHAPRELIAAVAPDMILGQSLSNARRARPEASGGEVSSVAIGSGDSGDRAAHTDVATVTLSLFQVSSPGVAARHAQGHSPGGPGSRAGFARAALAAESPASKPPATVPTPEPTPGAQPPQGKKPIQPVALPGQGPSDGIEDHGLHGDHGHSQGLVHGTDDKRGQAHRHNHSGPTRSDSQKYDHGSDDRGHGYGHRGEHRGHDRGEHRCHGSRNDSREHGHGHGDHQDSGRHGGSGHHR